MVTNYGDDTDATPRMFFVYVFQTGDSVETIKLILKSYPQGAAAKDCEGNLSLHYAAYSYQPPSVFSDLVAAYRAGVREKNKDDESPVQIAFKNKQLRNMEVVNMLLDAAWLHAGGTL
jgi:hypothetical protein